MPAAREDSKADKISPTGFFHHSSLPKFETVSSHLNITRTTNPIPSQLSLDLSALFSLAVRQKGTTLRAFSEKLHPRGLA